MIQKLPNNIFFIIIKDFNTKQFFNIKNINKNFYNLTKLENIFNSPLLFTLSNKIISKKMVFEILKNIIKT